MSRKRTKDFLWSLYSLSTSMPVVHHLARKVVVRSRFGVELQLLDGRHHNQNSHRSILHFTANKCASQYVKGILRRCARESGMVHVRMAEYAESTDTPYLDDLSAGEMERYQHVFKPSGYLYSVFGGLVENIPNLDDYHIVLMLRDPRDVLTSGYYSDAFSHRLPPGKTRRRVERIELRQYAQQLDVDQYVIDQCEKVRRNYQRYLDLLLARHPHVCFTKYEDMIGDFRSWLDHLLGYCELEISPRLRRELWDEADKSRAVKDNSRQHLRQVVPGDHKRKLKAETTDHLNRALSNVLRALGYE